MKRVLIGMTAICVSLMAANAIGGEPTTVPHFLNYQSLLYDDGGNLVADGQTGVTFKVTDSAGTVLYEERQTLDVVHGAVSALVGNGLNGAGAPMGGIPESVLSPDSGKYLEVTVDGYPAEGSLEIVSVPYSIYAEKALAVADGSVTGAGLAKKSISMDHLADDLVTELATEMSTAGLIATRTDLTNLQTTFRSVSGASTIGVNAGLVYSGSNNLQAVLQDLDRAIQHRQVGVDAVQTSITNEITERTNHDTTLQNNINAEATARVAADAAEAATRNGKDDEFNERLRLIEGDNSPHPSAWGTVTAGGTIHGYHITGLSGSGSTYTISFSEPMANANYAVIVTSQSSTSLYVSNKTVNDFTLTYTGPGTRFDFIVIGP